MPKEDRRIMFTNEEVYNAIYAMCHKHQIKKPPPGRLHTITINEDQPEVVHIHLENPQDVKNDKRVLEYKRDFVAAALMLFCRGCGIPLPKSAKKSVVLEGETMILRVQI
jgi:hypothetical protein